MLTPELILEKAKELAEKQARAAGKSEEEVRKAVEEAVQQAKEFIQFLEQLGLIKEIEGKRCVVNPLLPDKCMTYTKPYAEDHYKLRPPAAAPDFEARCIRCALCYFQCHTYGYGAIRLGEPRDGFRQLGTPIVDDQIERPCNACFECTTVCPTGALQNVIAEAARRAGVKNYRKGGVIDRTLIVNYPDLIEKTRMGIAIIDPDLCWAWNSGDCKSCASACPFGAQVFELRVTEWGVHTRVKAVVKEDGSVETYCIGCGLCVRACPVVGAAIHVVPVEEFVRRYRSYKNTGMSYDEYLEMIRKVEHENPELAVIRAMYLNNYYILNLRGFVKEKVKKARE